MKREVKVKDELYTCYACDFATDTFLGVRRHEASKHGFEHVAALSSQHIAQHAYCSAGRETEH